MTSILLFTVVLLVVAIWPKRGLHVLWWAAVLWWLRMILPSMPTDLRSGMSVLRHFIPWTVLALPLFATAVWRGRPYTVGVSRRAVAGVALWVGAFAFALPYRDLAPDVGLPRQPYVLLGAIAWASVAPLPGLLAVAIPRQRDRAQS